MSMEKFPKKCMEEKYVVQKKKMLTTTACRVVFKCPEYHIKPDILR